MGRETSALVATKPAATPGTSSRTAAGTSLAPGFRFHPTDEELVCYYLKRKILNKPVRFNCIAVVDIYKNEPWELAGYSGLKSRDQEWYFFSALDKKYGNGARMNRATGKGYWKATGKDREIRREAQLIGMKKTLVFHSGRAPDGLRTNWVMHEYRIVEDELEKNGVMQDAYVLCRVFHKNNIGPPSGNRYAPFIEEEWDDDTAALVPGGDARDNLPAGGDAIGSNDVEQEIQSANKEPLNINELPRDFPNDYELPRVSQNVLPMCKRERSDDCPPLCVLNKQAPLPLLQYKRRRHHDMGNNHSNGSNDSTRTTQDHCSSTTTTVTTTTTTTSSATTTAISALLEFSLMESIEPKERPPVAPATYDATNLDSSVPPSCMKVVNDLQNEIHQISVERESLKLEMMSAHAMMNILQSRIDFLSKENEDLKRSTQLNKE